MNWKQQHNLSLISKLISDVWDLHSKFTSENYKLAYGFSIHTTEDEYKSIYSELVQIAVPLRTKAQQLQILFEGKIDHKSWELLQNYINYLEYFYPWNAIDFLEFRDCRHDFNTEFRHADSSIIHVCQKYISLE